MQDRGFAAGNNANASITADATVPAGGKLAITLKSGALSGDVIGFLIRARSRAQTTTANRAD